MTSEDLKRQVLVRVPVASHGLAHEVLDRWVAMYPRGFKFGPQAVQAAVRLVTRAAAAAAAGKR